MPEVTVDELFDRIVAAFEEFPGLKERALEELGQELTADVLGKMAASGLHNGGGRLREWQQYHIGSRKGYVAVRPIGSKEGATTGRNSPGAITNYVEGGHAVRRRSATATTRRRSQARLAAVPGRHFYAATASSAEERGNRLMRELGEELVARLEGRT